jgi:hypothetical protein
MKGKTPEYQKQEDSFIYWELEESRLFIIRSPGIAKCKTPKFKILGVGGVKSRDSSSQES